MVTTNDDPHGGNTEGNGLTGTSGGAYFVDEPVYVHYTAQLPAGATDVQFRYSTDAAYLDTGWFVDDVLVNGAAATRVVGGGRVVRDDRPPGQQLDAAGRRDVRPHAGRRLAVRDRRRAGNYVYRLEGDAISQSGLQHEVRERPRSRDFATLVSNLPTGDLTFLDADYALTVRKKKK